MHSQKMLQEAAAAGSKPDRETIDSRDKSLTRLYTLLGKYVTLEKLVLHRDTFYEFVEQTFAMFTLFSAIDFRVGHLSKFALCG